MIDCILWVLKRLNRQYRHPFFIFSWLTGQWVKGARWSGYFLEEICQENLHSIFCLWKSHLTPLSVWLTFLLQLPWCLSCKECWVYCIRSLEDQKVEEMQKSSKFLCQQFSKLIFTVKFQIGFKTIIFIFNQIWSLL